MGNKTIGDLLAEHAKKTSWDLSGTHKDPKGTFGALSVQVGGGHYKDMPIQPIEFILANSLGFCEGNAIKYLCRWKSKGGIEDLRKAKHYIDLLMENELGNN